MRYIVKCLVAVLAFSFVALSALSAKGAKLEEELELETPAGNLYGTLLLPADNSLATVVLIIPGSGPTDRDGNSTVAGKNNSLKMLAEGLAEKGIASLRIDKRGIAKSRAAALDEADMRFEDMVEDAVGWLTLLKKDSRFKKLGVVGHSEGSLVGMLAANIVDVSYFVSIAGVGRPAYEVLEDQLSNQLTPQLLDTAMYYMDELQAGREVANPNPLFASLFRPSVQPYMISWFKYNPASEITKLKAKILLVQGTTDIQVGSADLTRLASAAPNAKELIINGMNHVLKHVSGGKSEQMKSYANPDLSLADGLLEGIAKFLKS